MSNLRLSFLFFLLCTSPLAAQFNFEVGGGNYSDDDQKTLIYSGSASYTTKSHMNFTLGYSGKRTEALSNDLLNTLILQLNNGPKTPEEITQRFNIENSVTGSLDYSLSVGTNIGVNAGFGSATTSSSFWLGMNASRWFLQDTLQLTANITYTGLTAEPYTTNDLDGSIVTTAGKVNGTTLGLQFYQLTTPSLILRGGYTFIQRSDRPFAHGFQLEGRYFLGLLGAAIHASGTYYINKGMIEPVTLLGEVDANSVQVQWHQGIANRFVLMAGYRRYLETITPRVMGALQDKTGSDYIHGSLRWLFAGDKPWTTSGVPELSIFAGHYTANETTDALSEPNSGLMFGAAFKAPLDLKKKRKKRRRKSVRKVKNGGRKKGSNSSKRRKLYKKRR